MAARTWAVSDTVRVVDAAAVLGGGAYRPYAAMQLYRDGLATRILVDEDADKKLLLNLDIPAEVVVKFGNGLRNTYEEACALTRWVGKNKVHWIIIPTETFPSRRVKWIVARQLGTFDANVLIDVVAVPGYSADDWWTDKGGRQQFLTEIVKYFYYRVRYIFASC